MKYFLFFFLAFNAGMSVWAQERTITYGQPGTEEILHILRNLGYECIKITLPVDTTQAYEVELILEEYERRELQSMELASIPATYRRIIYPGHDQPLTYSYDAISFIFNIGGLNGYTNLQYIVPETISAAFPLNLKHGSRFYHTRPFEKQDFQTGEKIPVVLLGSAWQDERSGIYRFCGRKEMDSAMQDELFDMSPHYFIISVKLEENHDGPLDLSRRE